MWGVTVLGKWNASRVCDFVVLVFKVNGRWIKPTSLSSWFGVLWVLLCASCYKSLVFEVSAKL